MMMADIRSVCVFCGSAPGKHENYVLLAQELGARLGQLKITLVYGSGVNGLMGAVAKSAHENGGNVIGVVPKALADRPGTSIGDTIIVKNMHERKNKMGELADAFICLPGGFGTMEEVLEVITWSQLGIHAKPIILFNIQGFFDSLIAFVDRGVEDGFIRKENRNIFVIANSISEIFESIKTYIPSPAAFKLNWTSETNYDRNREELIG